MSANGVTLQRLERLADERERTNEKREDLLRIAEEEKRDLSEFEQEQLTRYRQEIEDLEAEIVQLAADAERVQGSKDVSRLLRADEDGPKAYPQAKVPVHRTFAEYARDSLIVRYPQIATLAAGQPANVPGVVDEARNRLERTLQDTLSSNIGGIIPAQYMGQIIDVINGSRPIVASARSVPLSRGTLTYPKIDTRPTVVKQSTEKTEGGTVKMEVSLQTITAETYLGGGDLSWQAVNWSTPDALQLWFDLAAEAYARATEEAIADVLEDTVAVGTVGTAADRLGTAGTETFAQWRAATISGLSSIYTATGGRSRPNTLYLSADRFFQLAGLGTDQSVQMSAVGSLDIGAMTGTWSGLRVVGSYGLDQYAAVLGDSGALLAAETPGAPVELRVVEPSIGGMEVGVIGAFVSAVMDANRFIHISAHS